MKTLKMLMLMCSTALMLFTSCSNDDGPSGGPLGMNNGYATLAVNDAGQYWFIDDDGETYYPSSKKEMSSYSIVDGNGQSKNGNRVYIYFDFYNESVTGYDHNIKLYKIEDVSSKPISKMTSPLELDMFGDASISLNSAVINGNWLDINYSVYTAKDVIHSITLVDNQVVTPSDVPEGYIYLELHHKVVSGLLTDAALANDYVSFKLPDSYNPKLQGKKGFYISLNSINSGQQYIKVDLKQ